MNRNMKEKYIIKYYELSYESDNEYDTTYTDSSSAYSSSDMVRPDVS